MKDHLLDATHTDPADTGKLTRLIKKDGNNYFHGTSKGWKYWEPTPPQAAALIAIKPPNIEAASNGYFVETSEYTEFIPFTNKLSNSLPDEVKVAWKAFHLKNDLL